MPLWVPSNLLTLDKPANLPPGSLVFVPPYSKGGAASPALRFDIHDDANGRVFEWLLWLQGGPWGPDKLQRTASKAQDFHSNDDVVAAIVPSAEIKVDLEIDLAERSIEDMVWHRASGLVASGDFGLRVVAGDHFQHRPNGIPIDVSNWRYDAGADRQPVVHWYRSWRVRIWDGAQMSFAIIPFELPKAE